MTTETTDGFDFINPLDGNTYRLPRYNPELYVDKISEHEDTIPDLPDPWTMLTTLTPEQQEAALAASQRQVSLLRTMSVLSTLDNHLPEVDDPAKAAIIANVNASEFAFIFKVFTDWVKSSGGEVKADQGEG